MTTGARPERGFAPVFCFVANYLTDILCVIGLALLTTGVGAAFGWPWALMVAGLVLLIIGMAAAWRRAG